MLSFPDRGPWGDPRFPGNCSGHVVRFLIEHYRPSMLLAVRLTDAAFPPWEQVVPRDNEHKIVVGRAALAEALKRVSLVARNGQIGVRLELEKGRLQLSVEDADLGDGREEIAATYDGRPFGLAFNVRYLLDLLDALDGDQVRLELAGELDAALVRPEGGDGQFGVVMPMRV